MGQPTYTFNFGNAESVIAQLDNLTKQIDTDLDALEKDVEGRLAEWTGAARSEYTAAKLKWDQAARDMATHLGAARVALDNISMNYITTEQQNMRNFGQLNGG